MTKLEKPVEAAILQPSCLSFDRKKTVFKLEREFDDDMKFGKKSDKNDLVRVITATDRQRDKRTSPKQ